MTRILIWSSLFKRLPKWRTITWIKWLRRSPYFSIKGRVRGEEIGRQNPSGDFLEQDIPMTTLEAPSGFPSNQKWAWKRTATLWVIFVTTTVESASGHWIFIKPEGHPRTLVLKNWSGGRRPENKMQIRITFQRPISAGRYASHHLKKRKEENLQVPRKRLSTLTTWQHDQAWVPRLKYSGVPGWREAVPAFDLSFRPVLSVRHCMGHNFLMQTCQLGAKSTSVYSNSGGAHGRKNLENPNAVQVCSQCWSLL